MFLKTRIPISSVFLIISGRTELSTRSKSVRVGQQLALHPIFLVGLVLNSTMILFFPRNISRNYLLDLIWSRGLNVCRSSFPEMEHRSLHISHVILAVFFYPNADSSKETTSLNMSTFRVYAYFCCIHDFFLFLLLSQLPLSLLVRGVEYDDT